MGANGGGGMGSSPHDMGGQMGNGSSQPAATEYTLQGLSLLLSLPVASSTTDPTLSQPRTSANGDGQV